ncbi:MAG: tetratricopeptide repeat protein [Deltaproteobacteria bacterium]|nr:tetratricopeptide repeat protein [Deltaproteobacteria bacterium]
MDGTGMRCAVLFVAAVALFVSACECEKQEREIDWRIESRYQRGNIALSKGNDEIAEKEYRWVLGQDGQHLGAHTKLARILIQRAAGGPVEKRAELLGEAIHLLENAVRLDPKNAPAWQDLAIACQQTGDQHKALQAMEKLRSIDPGNPEPTLALAKALEAYEKLDQAEAALRAGLDQDRAGEIHLALARLLLRRGKEAEAQETLRAIQACPKVDARTSKPIPCPTAAYYEARDELGSMAVRAGKLAEAREIYQEIVKLFPEDYMAWEVLAALDEKEKKWPEAEKKYRQSLELDRVHMSVWRGLGRVLLAQGKPDEARYSLRKADGFLSKSPEQALEMADELVQLGDPLWAKTLLERARILMAGKEAQLARIDARIVELQKGGADGGQEDKK